MLKKILFPTDLSMRSRDGFRWMAENVARPGTEVLLLHVVGPSAGVDTPTYVQEAEQELEDFERALGAHGLAGGSMALAGEEVETIARVADNERCSLVFFVVERGDDVLPVVSQIALPQMLVPASGDEVTTEPPFRHVVFATDLSPDRTEIVLGRLGKILAGEEVSLTLLHGVPLDDPASADDIVMAADEALQAVKGAIEPWKVNVATRLVSGEPDVELPAVLDELEPSLLVLGLPRHGDLWELFVGGTAEALIRAANCSILLIPS